MHSLAPNINSTILVATRFIIRSQMNKEEQNMTERGISIICPIKNLISSGRQSMVQTLLLSYAQSRNSNSELVFVEGQSHDSTYDFMKELIAKYEIEGILLTQCSGRGIYPAINHGASLATYDVLMFMGSDDRFFKGGVSLIHQNIAKSRADFFYWTQIVKSGEVLIREDPRPQSRILFGNYFCFQSFAIRKDTFFEFEGFSKDYSICSDFDLALRLSLSNRAGKRLPIEATVVDRNGESANVKEVKREISFILTDRVSSIRKMTPNQVEYTHRECRLPIQILVRVFSFHANRSLQVAMVLGVLRALEAALKRRLKK